jgi:hypothetical protein
MVPVGPVPGRPGSRASGQGSGPVQVVHLAVQVARFRG